MTSMMRLRSSFTWQWRATNSTHRVLVLVLALVLTSPVLSGCGGFDGPQDVDRQQDSAGITQTTSALEGANLGGANLGGANLGGVNLGGVNLGGANLGGVNLGGVNLGGANLGGTNLGGNNLGGNNLGGVNLGGANLGGVNLGGVNLGGTNLADTGLNGSKLPGLYAGSGCSLRGTEHLGDDLTLPTVGIDIHNLGAASSHRMLWSGEDRIPRASSCIVLGIGSTAMAKLVAQNRTGAAMYAALKQLPWGFAADSGGPIKLSAWEVVVWGRRSYSVFIVAAPPQVTYPGVAGFIKAIWRWAAPPSKTLHIGQIGGGEPVTSYPGMMDTATQFVDGAITEKAYLAGELALVTATTNNQSVLVDFSSWVRKRDGTGLILANVETPSSPAYGEAVYRAMEEPDGSIRIAVGPLPLAGGPIDSMGELGKAYTEWQGGLRPEKPTPRRCAGALFLNSINNAETDWQTKCDNGLAWSPETAGASGQTSWSAAGGGVTPYNDYMTIQSSGGGSYSTCRPTDIDPATNSCPSSSRLRVISETFVHMWEPAFTSSAANAATNLWAGYLNTCAQRSDGAVFCWGSNAAGQLGSTLYGFQPNYPPIQLDALGTDATHVAAGHNATCARKIDGTLWCWGGNDSGQLGNGTTIPQVIPVQVTALGNDVVDVSGAYHHFCARKTDGTLWCWGIDWWGNLGDGGAALEQRSPVQVTALGNDVAQVATGYGHTCARKTDGTLWCFGFNAGAQLGDGTTTDQFTPVQVTALGSDVAEVKCGFFNTCARKTDGTLWCWGLNDSGQVGDGTTTTRLTPVQVVALGTDVAEVSVGYLHTCARKTDGTLWCWGNNSSGQIGDGTNTTHSTPVQITALGGDVAEVSISYIQSCVRMIDGSIRCWGDNSIGQLAVGVSSYTAPVKLTALGNTVAEVVMGGLHGCARKLDGTVWCWGLWEMLGNGIPFVNSPVPAQVSGLSNVAELSAGNHFNCVRKFDGTVWCWGINTTWQLGDPTASNPHLLPVQVSGLSNVAELDSGEWHSCVRKFDNTVWCWGADFDGQLGNGGEADQFPHVVEPVTALGATVIELASGRNHTCARKLGGTVWCWGSNYNGQIGTGTAATVIPTPVQVTALGNSVVGISAYGDQTCARKINGTIWCWGRNDGAQLGDGTTTDRNTPVLVTSFTGIAAEIAQGGTHTCARKPNGTLWCWGSNYFGQMGIGSKSPVPVTTAVQATANVARSEAGNTQTCALKFDGTVWCWGNNTYGALGIGIWPNTLTPKVVAPW